MSQSPSQPQEWRLDGGRLYKGEIYVGLIVTSARGKLLAALNAPDADRERLDSAKLADRICTRFIGAAGCGEQWTYHGLRKEVMELIESAISQTEGGDETCATKSPNSPSQISSSNESLTDLPATPSSQSDSAASNAEPESHPPVSASPATAEEQRAVQWLKGRVRDLEERVATLEKVSHAPVDLKPAIEAILDERKQP